MKNRIYILLGALVLLSVLFTYNYLQVRQAPAKVSQKQVESLLRKQSKKSITEVASLPNVHLISTDSTGRSIFWNNTDRSLAQLQQDPSYRRFKNKKVHHHYAYNADVDTSPSRAFDSFGRWFLLLSYFAFIIGVFYFYRTLSEERSHSRITRILVHFFLLSGAIALIPIIDFTDINSAFDSLPINGLSWIAILIGATSIMRNIGLFNTVKNQTILGFLSAFGIAISFVVFTYIIGFTIDKVGTPYGLDVPLQYTMEGVMLFFLLAGLGLFTFYTAIHLYKKPSQKATPSFYFGLGLGLLLTYPVALLFDLKVPLLALFAFITSYLLILDIYKDLDKKPASFMFLWMIIYSGYLASLIFYFQLQHDISLRSSYAQELYTRENRPFAEKVKAIDQELRNSKLIDQLTQLRYPEILDREDFTAFVLNQISDKDGLSFKLECFESTGATLFKNHYANSVRSNNLLKKSTRRTDLIYYNPLEGAYYLNYKIENEQFPTTPIQLIVEIKETHAESNSPSTKFDYVVLKDSSVIAASDPFNLEPLSLLKTKHKSISMDHSIVHHKPVKGVNVYVPRKMDGLLGPISLFSFLLTITGILLLLLAFLNSRYNFLPSELDVRFNYESSLRNKIQFTVIALTIFSFIFIGLMTILYFRNVLEQQKVAEREGKISAVVNSIQADISDASDPRAVLAQNIDKISHIHNQQLALYSTAGGELIASSFTTDDVRLPYDIYADVRSSSQHMHNQDRHGNYTHYIPLRFNERVLYGILSLPETQYTVYNKNLLDFLSTILNVYIFLFLVAGAIAVAISNSITRPLSYLSEKLQGFKLGKSQEPLVWNSKDEIGSLISNYNSLVEQLEESADIIAKTERDTAWREMAKQVAHEIKNPLTPMKLSIQHLQRLSTAEGVDVKGMTSRISTTLLEQFNNLDNIANSFSNFASMPTADNDKIIINEVVASVHDLFRKREDMEITLSEPINDMYVYADRNHLVRILNNIVKNAIQAVPLDRKGKIHIELEQVKDIAKITVSDNGVGIPEDMKKKVFTPNFTTKNSGTGLGLAISANFIESFNGKIYFETEVDKGTDFIIEIPLMRLDQNYDSKNRVVLD